MTKDDDVVVELYPFNKLSDYEQKAFKIQCISPSISNMYFLNEVQDKRLEELMEPVVDHLLQCQKENYDE